MAKDHDKARQRVERWRRKRYKYREIAQATGVSESVLCRAMKTTDSVFSDEMTARIMAADEPEF